jgi:hypothetical protein
MAAATYQAPHSESKRHGQGEARAVVATTATAALPGWTPALVFRNLFAFAGNMFQVYGVLYWGWDMFQILMLYWMETGIIGFWALLRLAVLPQGMLGDMTVNGRVVAATNTLLLQMFVPFVAISMAGHLLILWAVFSGPSAAGVHGPVSFASNSSSRPGPGCRCCSRFWRARSVFMKVPNEKTFCPPSGYRRSIRRALSSKIRKAMVSARRSAARSAAS